MNIRKTWSFELHDTQTFVNFTSIKALESQKNTGFLGDDVMMKFELTELIEVVILVTISEKNWIGVQFHSNFMSWTT